MGFGEVGLRCELSRARRAGTRRRRRAFAYDGRGFLTSETHPEKGLPEERGPTRFGGGGRSGRTSKRDTQTWINGNPGEAFTQTFGAWDHLGNLTSLSYPQCTHAACTAPVPRTVTYGYTDGRLTSVPGWATIAYHPNGMTKSIAHGNAVTVNLTKDDWNRPRPKAIATSGALNPQGATHEWTTGTYAYDGSGNVTHVGSSRFVYDGLSRLASAAIPAVQNGSTVADKTQSYTYDTAGNLTSTTTNGVLVNSPAAIASNRLTSGTYDAAGNLLSWNGNTYAYDRFGMLWKKNTGTLEDVYLYTADDERIWIYPAIGGGATTWTLRDLGGKVLREYKNTAGTWSVNRDYVYGNGQLLGAVTTGGNHYLHVDHLGTPRLITNANRQRVTYHAYYPFGQEATSPTQDTERMKFTGHERDLGATGGANPTADDLDYMHARFYNPTPGRFLSVDPADSHKLRQPQTWNRYSYVGNNPVKYVDPSGAERAAVMQDVTARQYLEGEISREEYVESMTRPGPAALVAAGAAGLSLAAMAPELAVLGQSLWLNPGIQGTFATVAAGLADQGVPTSRFASLVRGADAFSPGQLAQFERQVSSEGIQSLLKSRQTFQTRLTQHLGKLEEILAQGGHTSSVEREIRNFAQQINAIDDVLGKGGYKIIQGELVRFPRK